MSRVATFLMCSLEAGHMRPVATGRTTHPVAHVLAHMLAHVPPHVLAHVLEMPAIQGKVATLIWPKKHVFGTHNLKMIFFDL